MHDLQACQRMEQLLGDADGILSRGAIARWCGAIERGEVSEADVQFVANAILDKLGHQHG